MSFHHVSLDSLVNTMYQNPGLVIGPGCTLVESDVTTSIDSIITENTDLVDVDGSVQIAEFIDMVRAVDSSRAVAIEDEIKHIYSNVPINFDLNHIAKCSWSAVISLTFDMNFEVQFSNKLDSVPSSKSSTVVSSAGLNLPQRTTPIFKLFGSGVEVLPERRLVLSASEILIRKNQWAAMLRDLSDYVRGSPLVFLGTGRSLEYVRTLLSNLVSIPPPACRRLIFLKDDSTYFDQTVSALLSNFEVEICDATIRQFAAEIAILKPSTGATKFTNEYSAYGQTVEKKLESYKSIVSLVPSDVAEDVDFSTHRASLLDSLFRPISVDWTPFLLRVDLKRSVVDELTRIIDDGNGNGPDGNQKHVVIRGEAGVGKTTLLKRLAVELSGKGFIVLWFRRCAAGTPYSSYRDLAFDLKFFAEKEAGTVGLVFIFDNPKALGVDVDMFADLLESTSVNATFIYSFRNTDYFGSQSNISVGNGSVERNTHVVEVPFELDDTEMTGLPEMLVNIGVAVDLIDAKSRVSSVRAKNAKDILCSLWYLIPETQFQISQSLTDEYLELGDIESKVTSTAQGAAEQSMAAKRAYEAVTVISNLGLGIPVEVLVRYLKIEYSEWMEMSGEGRPIWGLLYAEIDDDETTNFFRTRNEVVTSVLLNLVNGGAVGHSGEARVISELISACSGGTSIYREFMTSILIGSSSKLKSIYTTEQGVKLFDIARQALQYPDRVLELHKGLWMSQDKSRLKQAYEQYAFTLDCPEFPGSERAAPVEHVFNSMAANVLQMVKSGQQEAESGRVLIEQHLQQASNSKYFSAHSLHVSANLYYEMSQQASSSEIVQCESLAKSLTIIEMALQKIGSVGGRRLNNNKDVEFLTKLRSNILLNYENLDDLKAAALRIYTETKSIVGFVTAARVELAEATANEKGRKYNKAAEYIDDCIRLIKKDIEEVSVDLLAARLDVVVRWKLQRPSGFVDWAQIKDDSENVIQSTRYNSEPIRLYYLAIAHYHLGDTSTANAFFSKLRASRQPGLDYRGRRNWFVGDHGHAKRFQCEIQQNQGRYYAAITELGIDIEITRRVPKGGGAVTHAYIAFNLNGASVSFDKPTDSALFIP